MVTIPSMKGVFKSLFVELLGTCLLVVIGCGSVLSLTGPEGTDTTGAGLAWGFAVATLVQAFGHVGGCHINPCVTVAMAITRKKHAVMAGLYILTQCMGAVLGAFILKLIIPSQSQGNLGMTVLTGVTPIQGVFMEFIATFLLVSVVFGVSDESRKDLKGSSSLAIGLCVTALILFCGPFTGAGLNPARSFGPSLVLRNWQNHWVYWAGPLGGAVFAALLYQLCFRAPEDNATVVIGNGCSCSKQQNGHVNLALPAQPDI